MTAELRAFVFGVTFIVIFSVLIATIPAGLQGPEETPDGITALDPYTITGFSESEVYTKSNFTGTQHTYDLGGRSWLCLGTSAGFGLWAKVLLFGFLWLGGTEQVKFISSSGIDRGTELLFTEIALDAEEGFIQYSLSYTESGASAGGFLVYWNTTTYSDPAESWDNNELYTVHGVGIEETATADMGALLISLLLLQLPDVPLLVNMLLVVPIWASIIFILWFIIKETLPFV